MRWTLPNILTVIRLIAAPALPMMFLLLPRPLADWIALVLFAGAALTDWFDGYYARSRNLVSRFGAMLDPIADKAMVIIALTVILAFSSLTWWVVLPATLIIFREVFVSGLREFLGSDAKTLAVTGLAKWKTSVQMTAIAVIFASDIFLYHLVQRAESLPTGDVLNGAIAETAGFGWLSFGHEALGGLGVVLLWTAAGMTLWTGWDYFTKAYPFLKDEP